MVADYDLDLAFRALELVAELRCRLAAAGFGEHAIFLGSELEDEYYAV